MLRNVDLRDISDGKLYTANDLVRADCGGCEGCSACCRDMGQSIVLDPLDVARLNWGLGLSFEELLADKIELNVVDGLILPNLRMRDGVLPETEQKDACGLSDTEQKGDRDLQESERTNACGLPETEQGGACGFLDADGRCSIHPFRPGICRLFPLGRYYADGGFRYFLQVHECRRENRAKVKVKKWIDTPDLKANEKYINDWHDFLRDMQGFLARFPDDVKKVTVDILKRFYLVPFPEEKKFYAQFEERLARARKYYF